MSSWGKGFCDVISFSKAKDEFEKKLGRLLNNDEKDFLKWLHKQQEGGTKQKKRGK